jgi:hypothetical protein
MCSLRTPYPFYANNFICDYKAKLVQKCLILNKTAIFFQYFFTENKNYLRTLFLLLLPTFWGPSYHAELPFY